METPAGYYNIQGWDSDGKRFAEWIVGDTTPIETLAEARQVLQSLAHHRDFCECPMRIVRYRADGGEDVVEEYTPDVSS